MPALPFRPALCLAGFLGALTVTDARAQDYPADPYVGGLVFPRESRADGAVRSTVSVGGGILPRRVRETITYPATASIDSLMTPRALPAEARTETLPQPRPVPPPAGPADKNDEVLPPPRVVPGGPSVNATARLRIWVPDDAALIYIDDMPTATRGYARLLVTPELPAGKEFTYRIRAAFREGPDLLIEEKTVTVRAGRTTPVPFTGDDAKRVPLPSLVPPGMGPRPMHPVPPVFDLPRIPGSEDRRIR